MTTESRPRPFGDLTFGGFVLIRDLWASDYATIPDEIGVYQVLRASVASPRFLLQSPAGRFKGKDPTVSRERLQEKWIPGAHVLYIGKAGSTAARNQTLRRRLRQYLDFGKGRPIGHWGGRLIWQLADAADLLICWLPTQRTDPRAVERRLIAGFEKEHGSLPFANLRR